MTQKLNDVVAEVTERIGGRSASARGEYLERTRKRKLVEPARGKLACANLRLSDAQVERIFYGNAAELFGLPT